MSLVGWQKLGKFWLSGVIHSGVTNPPSLVKAQHAVDHLQVLPKGSDGSFPAEPSQLSTSEHVTCSCQGLKDSKGSRLSAHALTALFMLLKR